MALPLLRTTIPGPRSRALARQLRAVESRNVTYISADWPIFWQRARGANVWDTDGNRYLDLTAAFGVANVGHSNPRVTAAISRQAATLTHAMGDVHPNARKLQLARELIALSFGRWRNLDMNRDDRLPSCPGSGRVVFGNSGAEAVEIALKTALLHTGKRGVIAFAGAYHGLTYGALAVTGRAMFRAPFAGQLGRFVTHIPFGQLPTKSSNCGAVIIEPIQGRGGMIEPPAGFLPALRAYCDRHGLLLILDEIYTGLGRTGRWFACEHWGVLPDLICVGKSLGGGLPLSACIGRTTVMNSWPLSQGEAIHTSTFLGNPVACAAGLAVLAELKGRRLIERAETLGRLLRTELPAVRGRGLMLGLPVPSAAGLCKELLQRGIIALPEGEQDAVLGLTPPLTITEAELRFGLRQIRSLLGQ